jgi:hypothetical protein
MGRRRYSSSALTLALDGGCWSVSHLGCFTAGKVAPTTSQMEEGWACPRAVPYYCICIYKATHRKLEMAHCVFCETRLAGICFLVVGGGFGVVRAIDMDQVQ